MLKSASSFLIPTSRLLTNSEKRRGLIFKGIEKSVRLRSSRVKKHRKSPRYTKVIRSDYRIRNRRKSCTKQMRLCENNFPPWIIGTHVLNCDQHTKRLAKFKKQQTYSNLKFCRERCVHK